MIMTIEDILKLPGIEHILFAGGVLLIGLVYAAQKRSERDRN